jgi:hypothetical protein
MTKKKNDGQNYLEKLDLIIEKNRNNSSALKKIMDAIDQKNKKSKSVSKQKKTNHYEK